MYRESAMKLFVKYAIPQMIGLLFNSVYVIVDGVFIGKRLGSAALAAAGIGVPAVELLIALSIGIASCFEVKRTVQDRRNARITASTEGRNLFSKNRQRLPDSVL